MLDRKIFYLNIYQTNIEVGYKSNTKSPFISIGTVVFDEKSTTEPGGNEIKLGYKANLNRFKLVQAVKRLEFSGSQQKTIVGRVMNVIQTHK